MALRIKFFLCVLCGLCGVFLSFARAQTRPQQAVVETSAGTFVIDLAPDAAPNQTAYFMKLAGSGAYDGTTFHRAVKYGMVWSLFPRMRDSMVSLPGFDDGFPHSREQRG